MQRLGSLHLQWDSWCKICWVLVDSSNSSGRHTATHSNPSWGMSTYGSGQYLDHTGHHCYFVISHCRTWEQGISQHTFDEKGISFALGQFEPSPFLWMGVKTMGHQRSRGCLTVPSLRPQDNHKALRKSSLPSLLPWTVRLKQEVRSEMAVGKTALRLQRKTKDQIPVRVNSGSKTSFKS